MITLLTAVGAVPTIIGTTQAIQHGQRQNERQKHRGRRSNLTVTLPRKNSYSAQFDGAKVVLQNHKLYVDIAANTTRTQDPNSDDDTVPPGSSSTPTTIATTAAETGSGTTTSQAHLFSGFYHPRPTLQPEWARQGFPGGSGLVSTIRDEPPDLNWIYVDRGTLEVKYGSRAEAAGHLLGPWDCTAGRERRVTFEGWEGFLAVEEQDDGGVWALYFDRANDALGGRCVRRLAVLLSRCEPARTKEMMEEERAELVKRQAGGD